MPIFCGKYSICAAAAAERGANLFFLFYFIPFSSPLPLPFHFPSSFPSLFIFLPSLFSFSTVRGSLFNSCLSSACFELSADLPRTPSICSEPPLAPNNTTHLAIRSLFPRLSLSLSISVSWEFCNPLFLLPTPPSTYISGLQANSCQSTQIIRILNGGPYSVVFPPKSEPGRLYVKAHSRSHSHTHKYMHTLSLLLTHLHKRTHALSLSPMGSPIWPVIFAHFIAEIHRAVEDGLSIVAVSPSSTMSPGSSREPTSMTCPAS